MNTAQFSLKPNSRILLVEPPFYRFFGYERWHYPVTLTLVGSFFEQQGHFVRIYDADKPTLDCKPLNRLDAVNNYPRYGEALLNANHPIWREVVSAIKEFRPDVVGLTAITAKIDSADIIAKLTRELLGRDVKILLGGSHVQGMSLMKPDYDFGPYYDQVIARIPDVIRFKPNKKLILDYETYSPANFSGIMTSSGCPNKCTFCCHSFEKSMTYREISNIRKELVEIKESFGGMVPVYILDDCFFSNKAHFENVISVLHDLGLSFSAGSRIMALSPGKIDLFIKKGGIRILVGVESGSQRILDRVEKRLKIEEIVRRTQWLNDAGIPWSAFFMVGFPFETHDDLKRTEEILYKIRPTFASINRFTPYPGTKIYSEYFADKKLEFKNLFQLNRNSCVKLTDEIEDYIERLFVAFDEYNRQNRMKHF